MSKPIRLYLPRIYLDSNVLVSAILESDPKWQRIHSKEAKAKRVEIKTSNDLYSEWEPKRMKTSLFAISEFIATGRSDRFNKTFNEMMDIVAKEILSKCEILYANFVVPNPSVIDKRWNNFWILGKSSARGLMSDGKGNSLGMQELGAILTIDMRLVKHIAGGVPLGVGFPNPSEVIIEKLEQMQYGSPAFEILLFNKASELAISYNIHLSDAIHIYHAQNAAEFFVTNDKKFIKSWDKIDPKLKKKAYVEPITSKEALDKLR